MHAQAIVTPRHDLLAVDDTGVIVGSSRTFLARGRGRIILTRADLLDAGASLTSDGRRFSPESGQIVDRILDHINAR